MCFCSMSGNTLSFVLKSEWRGRVTVQFNGTLKKRVTVDWGMPGQPLEELDFCTLGPHHTVSRRNPTPQGLNVTLQVFCAPDDCTSGMPTIDPVTNGSQVICNESGTTQSAVFLFEVPGSGETVQVEISNEEDQQIP